MHGIIGIMLALYAEDPYFI